MNFPCGTSQSRKPNHSGKYIFLIYVCKFSFCFVLSLSSFYGSGDQTQILASEMQALRSSGEQIGRAKRIRAGSGTLTVQVRGKTQ